MSEHAPFKVAFCCAEIMAYLNRKPQSLKSPNSKPKAGTPNLGRIFVDISTVYVYTLSMKPAGINSLRYNTLLQLLRTADSILDASRIFFAPWDLSPSQFNVLNLLYGRPEGLSQTDVGRQLIVHRSNVTGLVDRLEKRGLVKRRELAKDRRVYQVVLTAEGSRVMEEVLPLYHRKAEEVWGDCPVKLLTEIHAQLTQAARRAVQIAGVGSKAERS
jgi:DNA-binding MarR family transcriptional regulator